MLRFALLFVFATMPALVFASQSREESIGSKTSAVSLSKASNSDNDTDSDLDDIDEKSSTLKRIIKKIYKNDIKGLQELLGDRRSFSDKRLEDVRFIDKSGYTLLHWAVIYDRPDVARMLLQDYRIDTTIRDFARNDARSYSRSPAMRKVFDEFDVTKKE